MVALWWLFVSSRVNKLVPVIPYCGRCRNLELTILTNLFRHTCLHVNKLAFLSVFLSVCLSVCLTHYVCICLTHLPTTVFCVKPTPVCLSACLSSVSLSVSLCMHPSPHMHLFLIACQSLSSFILVTFPGKPFTPIWINISYWKNDTYFASNWKLPSSTYTACFSGLSVHFWAFIWTLSHSSCIFLYYRLTYRIAL